jgi:DNA-binding CsgD family transcriptional regulator
VREIAARLYVTQNAVKAHLSNLYDKFGIPDDPGVNRRVALANEAVERGAVSLSDLNEATGDDEPER